jgi:hypothetical protein
MSRRQGREDAFPPGSRELRPGGGSVSLWADQGVREELDRTPATPPRHRSHHGVRHWVEQEMPDERAARPDDLAEPRLKWAQRRPQWVRHPTEPAQHPRERAGRPPDRRGRPSE